MRDMLAQVLNATFERECGKFQIDKPSPQLFRVLFSLKIDHAKEQGYRTLDVIFWAPLNYVQVWVRETWEVVPIEDLADDDDGLKPGKSYTEGETEWKKVADHDSGWRDAIDRILKENEARITGFRGGHYWACLEAWGFPFTPPSH